MNWLLHEEPGDGERGFTRAGSTGVEIGLDIHAGITHLRKLVTQGARADAQALGGFLAPTAFGPQRVDDDLELAATQILPRPASTVGNASLVGTVGGMTLGTTARRGAAA